MNAATRLLSLIALLIAFPHCFGAEPAPTGPSPAEMNDAERAAVRAVLADQRDGLGEVGIRQRGHRDQQMIRE